MFNSLTLNSNRKVTSWISTGESSENIKLFGPNLALIMYNLANGRVSLKFINSVLM